VTEYLAIMLAIAILCVVAKFWFRLVLYPTYWHLLIANLAYFLVGFAWDSYSTYRGHWVYAPGVAYLGCIPVEELPFYFVAPFLIVTIYRLTERWVGKPKQRRPEEYWSDTSWYC
jgi:lycopene cyclase domain-containing protein